MGTRVGRAALIAGVLVHALMERDSQILESTDGKHDADEFRRALEAIEQRHVMVAEPIDYTDKPRRTSKGERKRNKHDRWR